MIKSINWEYIHLSLQQWEKIFIYMWFIYLYLYIIIYRAIFLCLHYFFQIWLRIAHETQHIAWSTVYINIYIWTLLDISHSIGMFYRIPKKMKKGKKRLLNWFIASVMRDITWKISWKVTWIGMNKIHIKYELAND